MYQRYQMYNQQLVGRKWVSDKLSSVFTIFACISSSSLPTQNPERCNVKRYHCNISEKNDFSEQLSVKKNSPPCTFSYRHWVQLQVQEIPEKQILRILTSLELTQAQPIRQCSGFVPPCQSIKQTLTSDKKNWKATAQSFFYLYAVH